MTTREVISRPVVDLNRIPSILLQTLLTVAEAGQISEAARRFHLSQSAVTGHIRRLEANLETTLFIRSANGVSLAERGALLRERVQDIFAELEQILRELDRTREVNGTLILAASTTVARYFVSVSSDRLTFLVFEFRECFLGPSPAASLADFLVSSLSSPIRSERNYLR
jgi:molybdenum-dependent DNA-binding transcriptional regulator ModE